MADQERSDFCVVFTMSLCTLKINVNNFAISTRTALKLSIQALGSYLKLTGEYELHILSNTKVDAAKDLGKNYMKIRAPLVCRL